MNEAADIGHNRRAHDVLGEGYDARHPEIFNDVEQERLARAVRRIVGLAGGAEASGRGVRALDVGSGTGNLTAQLIAAGATVTAADLSPALLDVVRRRFGGRGLEDAVALSGADLRPLADGAFDLVAAYSVLHHVPDYIAFVGEMARVAAPGGIVMIDHERSDASWTSADYAAFLREAVPAPRRRRWWYWLQPSRYRKRLRPLLEWRRWRNPRWMPEGDLHIWPDDHIEWDMVERALAAGGCETIVREPYLLFEPRYRRDVWEKWRGRVTDMQLFVARKGI